MENEMNLRNQLMAWASTHNLSWLIAFHNYVRALFKEQLQNLEKYETNALGNKLHKDALYHYDRILHINTFLMMYSYLEEFLFHYRKEYTPNVNLIVGKGSISRFKDVVKQLGVDLSSKLWQELKNAEEIRNCLLHANGRISLLKNPKKVKTIIEKKDSSLVIDKDCVVISGTYLQRFNQHISTLMDIMNNQPTQQQKSD
jgi:hypothetical protein